MPYNVKLNYVFITERLAKCILPTLTVFMYYSLLLYLLQLNCVAVDFEAYQLLIRNFVKYFHLLRTYWRSNSNCCHHNVETAPNTN